MKQLGKQLLFVFQFLLFESDPDSRFQDLLFLLQLLLLLPNRSFLVRDCVVDSTELCRVLHSLFLYDPTLRNTVTFSSSG